MELDSRFFPHRTGVLHCSFGWNWSAIFFSFCGTGVPTFLIERNWSANFFVFVELECQLLLLRNWGAMFHLASNSDKLECRTGVPSDSDKLELECVYFFLGTGVPNWSAKRMWHSSSCMNMNNFFPALFKTASVGLFFCFAGTSQG